MAVFLLTMKSSGPMSRRFFGELPSETIARSYAGHHQVVNAIADDQGGDAFVREKSALHFGIRKHCVPFYVNDEADEPSGVEMVKSIDYDGAATNGLRYEKPDITGLDMTYLLS
jgi:hypothetical protein